MERCPDCGKEFATRQKLASHRYNLHGVRAGGVKRGRPRKLKTRRSTSPRRPSMIEVSVKVGDQTMDLDGLERFVKEGEAVLRRFRR